MSARSADITTAPADHSRRLRAAAVSGLVSAGGVLVFLFASGIFNARALGPTDRGYFALVTITPTVLCQLAGFGTSLALTHFVASREISASDALRALKPIFGLQVAGATIATLLIGTALNWHHSTTVRIVAAALALDVTAVFFRDYGIAVIQGCGLNTRGNLLRITPPGLWAVGIMAVYFLKPHSLTAASIAFLLADSVGSLIIVLFARNAVRGASQTSIQRSVTRDGMLRYGRMGFFGFLSPLENLSLDQFFVSTLHSATGLGYYATASSFTNIPRIIATNLGMTASPIVSAAESRGASKRTAGLIFIWLTMAVTIVVTIVLAAAVTVLIPALFGEPFRPAIRICQVLLISGPVMALRRILVDVLRGAGRPVGTRAELLGLAVFIASAPVLSHHLGTIGVAWAFVFANGSNLLLLVTLEWLHRSKATKAPLN